MESGGKSCLQVVSPLSRGASQSRHAVYFPRVGTTHPPSLPLAAFPSSNAQWVKHWAVEFGRKSPRMAVTGRFGNWVGRLSFNFPQRKKGEKKISMEGIDP